MKLSFVVVMALAVAPLSAQLRKTPVADSSPYPPAFQVPQTAPEIPFDPPDPDYFMLPGDANFGEVTAVATNSKGHVFILSRSNATGNVYGGIATQLFEFDDKGNYIRELGRALYGFGYAHGVRVDKDDNIWVVDKGTDMAIKFNHTTGKVGMVLGRREEATSQHNYHDTSPPLDARFKEPTDIAWDSQGNIYVSDGYVNSRVAKFDKDGRWIGSWGERGTKPGQFRTVHNIAIDKSDRVWVADRTNGRLQVFDTNGNFLKEVIINVRPPKGLGALLGHQYPPALNAAPDANMAYRPGSPDAMCIPPDNPNVMFIGDLYPGRVYKINLDGKVLGYFGQNGKRPGEMGGVHGIACPNENLIYTAEFINWRTQKFVLHPGRTTTTAAKPAGGQ